ncbi:MAG: histidine phosphatase family protein [Bacteroidota bacterium]
MKNKTIFVLRHGETDLNKYGMVQGRGVDASLNETGREQAAKTYLHLKNIPFDAVFTSALKRSQETVKFFIEDEIPHIKHAGLDEISWGNQEGVKATLEAKNLYAQTIKGWQEGKLELSVGGGESPVEVMERQKGAVDEILNYDGKTILVCMHGRAMRILLCWLLKYPLNYMDGFPHNNCAYYKLIYRGEDFFVKEFNYCRHLS